MKEDVDYIDHLELNYSYSSDDDDCFNDIIERYSEVDYQLNNNVTVTTDLVNRNKTQYPFYEQQWQDKRTIDYNNAYNNAYNISNGVSNNTTAVNATNSVKSNDNESLLSKKHTNYNVVNNNISMISNEEIQSHQMSLEDAITFIFSDFIIPQDIFTERSNTEIDGLNTNQNVFEVDIMTALKLDNQNIKSIETQSEKLSVKKIYKNKYVPWYHVFLITFKEVGVAFINIHLKNGVSRKIKFVIVEKSIVIGNRTSIRDNVYMTIMNDIEYMKIVDFVYDSISFDRSIYFIYCDFDFTKRYDIKYTRKYLRTFYSFVSIINQCCEHYAIGKTPKITLIVEPDLFNYDMIYTGIRDSSITTFITIINTIIRIHSRYCTIVSRYVFDGRNGINEVLL